MFVSRDMRDNIINALQLKFVNYISLKQRVPMNTSREWHGLVQPIYSMLNGLLSINKKSNAEP